MDGIDFVFAVEGEGRLRILNEVPDEVVRTSRFSPETFRFSLEINLSGWLSNPELILTAGALGESSEKRTRILAVLPSNSPAALLQTVFSCLAAGCRLTVRPSKSNREHVEAWVDYLRKKIPEIDMEVILGDRFSWENVRKTYAACVAFGSDESILEIGGLWGCDETFIGYGHRFSVGYVEAVGDRIDEAASAAAVDIVVWDQNGCLSPQTIFVAGDARHFAKSLARELEKMEKKYPRAALPAGEAMRIHSFRSYAKATGGEVHASEKLTAWTVAFSEKPILEETPLNRCVWVRSVRSFERCLEVLEPEHAHLEAICVGPGEVNAGTIFDRDDLLVPLGRMQAEPLTRRHSNLPPLVQSLVF